MTSAPQRDATTVAVGQWSADEIDRAPVVSGPWRNWLLPFTTSMACIRAVVGKKYAAGEAYGAGAISTPSSINVTLLLRSLPAPRKPMFGRSPKPSSSWMLTPGTERSMRCTSVLPPRCTSLGPRYHAEPAIARDGPLPPVILADATKAGRSLTLSESTTDNVAGTGPARNCTVLLPEEVTDTWTLSPLQVKHAFPCGSATRCCSWAVTAAKGPDRLAGPSPAHKLNAGLVPTARR